MNRHVSKKTIEQLCGKVSVRSGDALRRSNKVKFIEYLEDSCRAEVHSTEVFEVSIQDGPGGSFQTACSCPKLVSFKQECQHVAAVLLSIHEYQKNGTFPDRKRKPAEEPDYGYAAGLLTAFDDQPVLSTGEQHYFEKREVLQAAFTLKPVQIGTGDNRMALKMTVHGEAVERIGEFLKHIKQREAYPFSSFLFDTGRFCFARETDAVFAALAEHSRYDEGEELILQPEVWNQVLPLLKKAPLVSVEAGNRAYDGVLQSKDKLPLQFDLYEEDRGYRLRTDGLKQLVMLASFETVLADGVFYPLSTLDYARLAEIKRVTDSAGSKSVPIPPDQIRVYLQKVVPGLQKLGRVHVSDTLSKKMADTPLKARLYLDRLKQRLLAGLEFQYGSITFNPLDEKEVLALKRVIRDSEKEDIILKMMEESSFAKTDGGYFLQNELLEYEFLYHVLPKLEKLVQVHATTAIRTRIVREPAPPRIKVQAKKERTNWLEFKFELDDIPEKQIREVLLAIKEKKKYYRLKSGALLSLEKREYEEIRRFLEAAPVQEEDWDQILDVPMLEGMKLLDALEGSNPAELHASFHRMMDRILNPDENKYLVPDRLDPVLKEYQKKGFRWLKALAEMGVGGILADDMGLGKTLQSIAFICSILPEMQKNGRPVLVVCPSSLVYNWRNEFEKFAPELKVSVMSGSRADRLKLFDQDAQVLIASYTILRKDIHSFEKKLFHTVFFDEAQAFKNPVTQTARAVKKIKADHRFALTGTPVENSQEELWSIFHAVFPELFMGIKEYSKLTRKQIARRIRPFLLRRIKEDVLSELPEKMESIETADLLPEQKKLYGAFLAKLRHDALKHLDKDTFPNQRIRILAGITRLRQICCHPALFIDDYKGGSGKFALLLKILEEARLSGRRVLIFSQFTQMLDLIGRELAQNGVPFFYLDGQTPLEERVELCSRFNAGENSHFLISLKAGGTGLNLTGADTVIHYDSWWNPAVEEQAADRAHRMGQTSQVQVIKLISRGTIEEKMNELLNRKRLLIKELIDYKSDALLTREDLMHLLD
ncbi:helicase SNF [Bacillus mangrovi]|uniref:Helicase SNF n=1 Tax=Metabacillus mangrovi TaxID=1491830 RepID=A0A7X2V5Z9_9BACI|nr:DEAD/DEAH box helicase [Metabacillus mangrovi]MTH54719.1 helicase SNF [Metabacillus mangrovi]